ncbi:hypothetical protein ASC99_28150 [Kitasatospora sp. Root107]|nr:hypothetical protein ASC99_28150 [Kitasatospora sp. Root107]
MSLLYALPPAWLQRLPGWRAGRAAGGLLPPAARALVHADPEHEDWFASLLELGRRIHLHGILQSRRTYISEGL